MGKSAPNLGSPQAVAARPTPESELEQGYGHGHGQERGRELEYGSVPARLGRFRIVDRLGQGARSVVYRAYDPVLDRDAALKVTQEGAFRSPSALDRFLREARGLTQLRHPRIVPVIESGMDGAYSYLASALVTGRTLAQALASEGRFAPKRAARIARDLADALEHAHDAGLIHRDVKPSNILLDASDRPHLTDFGISQFLTNPAAGIKFLGSAPEYSAPELAKACLNDDEEEAESIATSWSDQYSLGAVLYEMLCGRPPFSGDPIELLRQAAHGEPEAPRLVASSVPRDLDAICRKMLSKDPMKRYPTCRELAADLRRWLDDVPIRGRTPGPIERMGRWMKRHPITAGLASLTVLGSSGSAIAGLTMASSLSEANGEVRETAAQAQAAAIAAGNKAELLEEQLYGRLIAMAQQAWRLDDAGRARELLDACPTNRRGWEWEYLSRLESAELMKIPGGQADLWSLAFAPDGRTAALADAEGKVRFANLDQGPASGSNRPQVLQAHGAAVYAVAFRRDGLRFATASADRTVKIWDVGAKKELMTLSGHEGEVWGVAYSPEGDRIATASADGAVRIWDAESGTIRHVLKGHTDRVISVAFSPDGKTLASAGYDAVVRLWSVEDGKSLNVLTGHDYPIYETVFTPDGKRLCTASADETARVYPLDDPANGGKPLILQARGGHVYDIDVSPDGQRIATAHSDQTIRIWSASDGRLLRVLRGHRGYVFGVAFHPDSKRVGSVSRDRDCRIWDATRDQEALAYYGHQAAIHTLSFLATQGEGGSGGRRIVSGSNEGPIRFWDPDGGQEILAVTPEGQAQTFAISPDGGTMAVVGAPPKNSTEPAVTIWDLKAGKLKTRLKIESGSANSAWFVAFWDDPKYLAICPGSNSIQIIDIETGKATQTFANWVSPLRSIAVRPDGQRLAGVVDSGSIWGWSPQDGSVAFHAEIVGGLGAIAFSPNNRLLAKVNSEGRVVLLNADDGKVIHTFPGHQGPGLALAFSPDSRRLATSGADRAIKIWSVATGQEVMTLKGHDDPVTALAFSPDGRSLASGSRDRVVRVWTIFAK